MKSAWKEIALILILTVLIPMLMLNTGRILLDRPPVHQELPEITPTSTSAVKDTERVVLVQLEDGTVVPMELETYLTGVVLGEMPAEFEPEALKAQAVVARTYTLRMRHNASKHPDADVCVISSCCQSFRDDDSGWEYEKVRSAVDETAGLVLTYEGELIEATYFSSSGGRTEDAVAVWGSDVPYLQATDSPEDAFSDQYMKTVTVTKQEFLDALGIETEANLENLLGKVTYTAGGGVDSIVIGDIIFQGTQLRQLLGLRSTAFQITAVGDHIIITTRGYGHRVGMSQYGAEAMALEGATFQEILAHYYQGTSLEEFVDKEYSIG